MYDHFQFILGQCEDATARICLRPQPGAYAQLLTASLYGPRCEYARTLPSDFQFAMRDSCDLELVVTDPCYWTPILPFLYDLRLKWQSAAGEASEQTIQVGLRRWDCVEDYFRLEGRRTVLRGVRCEDLSPEKLAQAHQGEVALIVDHFDREFFAAADRLGVAIVLELRSAGDELFNTLDQLDWSSSIVLALVDVEQLLQRDFIQHWPRQCLLAHCLTASSQASELIDPNTEVLAVELQTGERPPAWLADIDRPVIVIRSRVVEDSWDKARTACDRLQAELAPEFNLSGYFVGP